MNDAIWTISWAQACAEIAANSDKGRRRRWKRSRELYREAMQSLQSSQS